MGIFVGLLFGLGMFLIVGPKTTRRRGDAEPGWRRSTAELLAQAGVRGLGPGQFVAISLAAGLVVGFVIFAVTATWSLGLAFFVFAAFLPRTLVARRRRARVADLRGMWPDVVDNLASAAPQ